MNVREMLIREEGSRKSAYQDHLGYWTIGVGRLIDSRKNAGLSDDEVSYLLDNDIKRITTTIKDALPWFDTLNEPRQAVLIGMAFQMGMAGLLQFRNTLEAVRDQRWPTAAAGMLQSLWAKQTPARANRMARQMETGKWQ